MLKIVYNKPQSLSLEDFINEEYKTYVLESENNLSEDAIELKKAWILILDRLKTYGVLEITRTHKEITDRIEYFEKELEHSVKINDKDDIDMLNCILDELYWMIHENREE
jgi:hypothetical protein